MDSISENKEKAWVRLVRAHRRALGAIEAALKEADLPSLDWYDVLWELERNGAMRPRDLQASLLMQQSNLSRLVDRMKRAGLVACSNCKEDGRGQIVSLTDAGKTMRARMWPIYSDAIDRQFDGSTAEWLAALLGGVGR